MGCDSQFFIPEGAGLCCWRGPRRTCEHGLLWLAAFQHQTQYLSQGFNLKVTRPFMQDNSARTGGLAVDEDTVQ